MQHLTGNFTVIEAKLSEGVEITEMQLKFDKNIKFSKYNNNLIIDTVTNSASNLFLSEFTQVFSSDVIYIKSTSPLVGTGDFQILGLINIEKPFLNFSTGNNENYVKTTNNTYDTTDNRYELLLKDILEKDYDKEVNVKLIRLPFNTPHDSYDVTSLQVKWPSGLSMSEIKLKFDNPVEFSK